MGVFGSKNLWHTSLTAAASAADETADDAAEEIGADAAEDVPLLFFELPHPVSIATTTSPTPTAATRNVADG